MLFQKYKISDLIPAVYNPRKKLKPGDKEYEKMVEILAPTMAAAVVITPDTPRGLQKEILAQLLQAKGVPVQLADTGAEALQKAREQAGETDVVLVSGSLSFLAEYLQLEGGDERHGASR